ncbi:MAG: universal stress protein UspA [Kangiella sp.]|nr:MAG: universal stress protein UspA [Gammaproteobacteria bacterium]PHS19550.1 MAG: universal stress protein UspA [Kangiella sp.]
MANLEKMMSDKTNSDNPIFSGEKILACIDGSSMNKSVCDFATWIAKVTNRPLKLLHTIETSNNAAVSNYSGAIGLSSEQASLHKLSDDDKNKTKSLIEQGRLMLNESKKYVQELGFNQVETYQHHGGLAESLVDLKDEMRVMVIGVLAQSDKTNDEGTVHQIKSIIRAMHKPVLVVNKAYSDPKATMLAYDGKESSKKALQMMVSGKLFQGMLCHLVNVGKADAELLDEASKILNDAGIKTTCAHLEGKAHDALANYQLENNIDIMLMGAFSHNRFRDFLMGSFTAKMLDVTNCPLLLLR